MNAEAIPPLDRRIERTRLALREALNALLAVKTWDELSVQDLCERANVGRSTFYFHFRNKEELLESGLAELRVALAGEGGLGFLPGLLAHAAENRRLYRSFLGRGSSLVVQARFQEMVLGLVEAGLPPAEGQPWRREAAARGIAGAIVGVLGWWVEAKGAPPARDIQAILDQVLEAAR